PDNHYLKNIFTSADFTDAELNTILPAFKEVTFSKNDFLLKEGKTEQQYWFLETGVVRSFVIDTNGNDISTSFYSSGDVVIDWPSFFSAGTHPGEYPGTDGL
ncbi:MAG: cyclic nucleotide-binding domain-containing protein, partial [Saprospiraceae bacterium]